MCHNFLAPCKTTKVVKKIKNNIVFFQKKYLKQFLHGKKSVMFGLTIAMPAANPNITEFIPPLQQNQTK